MVEQNKQYTFLSEKEMNLIKDTWSGDEIIIRAFMKFLLQLPLKKEEKLGLEKLSKEKEILYVLRKMILPTFEYMDVPMEAMDMRMTGDYLTKTPAESLPFLQSKELFINYLEQQLLLLEENIMSNDGKIRLSDMTIPDEDDYDIWYVNTITRTSLINYLKKKIAVLENFAGQHTETLEEKIQNIQKNSSK